MVHFLRRLLRKPPFEVTKAEALQTARDLCRQRGWKADIAPNEVREGLICYHVITRGWYGAILWISVDGYTRRIVRANRINTKRASRSHEDEGPGAAMAGVPRTPYPPKPIARNANKWPE